MRYWSGKRPSPSDNTVSAIVLYSVRRTVALLESTQRWRLAVVTGLTLIGAALEVIGIGLVFPVVLLLLGQAPNTAAPRAVAAFGRLLPNNPHAAIMTGLFLLLAVFLIKNLFLSILAWLQMDLVGTIQEALSQRLFALYMRQPYPFHLRRNSAELLRNAVFEVDQLCAKAIIPLLTLIVEAPIGLAIFVFLLAVQPVAALAGMAVVAVAGGSFYALSRRPLTIWGRRRQHHEGERLRQFQQGLQMVKEIKLLGREEALLDWYRHHTTEGTQAVAHYETLQRLPRLWFEVLFVAAIVTVTLVLLARGATGAAIVPILGLFAAAAFRLIPSVSRLLTSVQALANAQPVITLLHSEMSELAQHVEAPALPPTDLGPALRESIRLDAVGVCHPGEREPALRDISLTLARGERVCFTGHSGAGKSTLIDVVLGLLAPTQGSVLVDGHDIAVAPRAWQRHIGYVPQSVKMIDDTLRRNVALGRTDEAIDDDAVRRALRLAGLEPWVVTQPAGLDTVLGENGARLSGGERQRVGIARALYHDPEVLVLDEPTSALDLATEEAILRRVLDLGDKTILMVAHRPTAVALCQRVIRMEHGRVVDDGTGKGAGGAQRTRQARTVPPRGVRPSATSSNRLRS